MDLVPLLDHMDEGLVAVLMGLLTGAVFGVAAQRSSFCLRAATVEFARGALGSRVAVWLPAFSTAVIWVQGAVLLGLFRSEEARMMAVTGSWSGAMIGGLMFGAGMVLARGCSGRLLVLAATGNLRAVVSGLIFAVVAQMSLHGWLAPARAWIAGLWVTPVGANVNLLHALGLPEGAGLLLGLAIAALAFHLVRRNGLGLRAMVFASGVGFAVALGWVLTFSLAQVAFEPVSVTSATFSGPSANMLMFFLTENPALDFDIGAGVTGGSIFVATAWLALFCMWVGAGVTDWLVDQGGLARRAAA